MKGHLAVVFTVALVSAAVTTVFAQEMKAPALEVEDTMDAIDNNLVNEMDAMNDMMDEAIDETNSMIEEETNSVVEEAGEAIKY